MKTNAYKFDLNTRTVANGRIKGMSSRSPLNRTVDSVLANNQADEVAELKTAIANRLTEAEETRTSALRKFSRLNTAKAGNALVNADVTIASLKAAQRRLEFMLSLIENKQDENNQVF